MNELTDILILAYLNGETTPEQQSCLLTWLEESEENKRYFRSLKDVYDLGRLEADMQMSETDRQWSRFVASISPRRPAHLLYGRRQLLRYVAIFILGLVSMAVIGLFTDRGMPRPFMAKVETGVSERTKVTLPDGSTVWVNACSSITYDQSFGGKERTVNMKGEAYFNVKKDRNRPFLVHTDKLTFRVTGTSFSVYSFEEEEVVSIALIEGSVTVEHAKGNEMLHPGEMLVYNKKDESLTRKRVISDTYTSWRYGEMYFEDISFEELTRRLERSFNVTFKFADQAVKQETFSGSFRKYESLETILKVIETSMPVKYKIEKDTVYIK